MTPRTTPRIPRSTTPGQLSLVALALTVLAGCTSMIPTYERPSSPVAQGWPGADTSAAAGPQVGKPAVEVSWDSYFNDTRLKQLIELALANNRDLRVAVLNIEQARAQVQIRRADLFPTVNAGISGSRTPTTSGGITSAYTAGLTLTAWEIDFFGRVASLKEAAMAQYLAVEESRKATQISLIAAVASGYLSLLADEELLDLTRQTVATREDSLKLTRLRFDNGASSELDVRQAESLSESARATLAQLQRQRAVDENALVLLIGQALPPGSVPAAGAGATSPLRMAPAMADVPAGLPSDLLVNRPDIRAAEQQLLAANANIGAARAAFFPRISLTAGLGTASKELSGLFQSGSFGWTLAPQALLPIFDAGRNQAGLETARATRDIAFAQYEKSIQSAFRDVSDALAGRASYGEQVRALQAQAEAEESRYKLADLRYHHGVASYLDLLDAQRTLFGVRQAVVQTRLAQLQTQVTLYKALGGGWQETVATTAANQPAR